MNATPHIVVLDGYTMNPGDISWEDLESLGNTRIYDRTAPEKVIERAKTADILVVNKIVIDKHVIAYLDNLKFVCVSATGYNNLDIPSLKARGIIASNVVGYAAKSVAQHVFASILQVTNKVQKYSEEVKNQKWSQSLDWCYYNDSIQELSGKVMGVYGLGSIGIEVAKIARVFGMQIAAHTRHPKPKYSQALEYVSLEELFNKSDILSLHAPLSNENRHVVNRNYLKLMKKNAIIINTSRGGLINENDLYRSLVEGEVQAACLDVLDGEPPIANHPLFSLDNCYITPHIAWASMESRQRLLVGVVNNIRSYIDGNAINLIT